MAEDRIEDTIVGQPLGNVGLTRWPAGLLGVLAAVTGLLGLRSPTSSKPKRTQAIADGTHLDLLIHVESAGEGLRVQVTPPSAPSVRSLRKDVELPTDRGAAELLRRTSSSPFRRRGSQQAKAVEEFGAFLFDAILDGAAEHAYRSSLNAALKQGRILRVVLRLEDDVADLPWEYLYDAERGAFLALSNDTSLVRLLDSAHATRSLEPIGKLRILAMSASPRQAVPLDVESERKLLEERLADHVDAGRAQLRFVTGATLADLERSLREFDPHLFYFSGHGEWSDEFNDGVIMFETEAGRAQPVPGPDLGALLNRSNLRLAVFNSCQAARASRDSRFAGITSSVVTQGVPAAIGMQFPIEDDNAIAFGATLLEQLAGGASIDGAVTAARMAVFAKRNSVDWGTPVLTTRISLDDVLPSRAQSATTARR